MNTLADIEKAILTLSRVECDRLVEWLEMFRRDRRRVCEPGTKYRAEPDSPMTFEEYLEVEANSQIRHEYLGGEVFAMSGVTPRHNRIASRLHGAFREHLKGGPCDSYMSEVAVKLRMSRDDYAYYPDVMVVCGREKGDERFFTDPKLIVEVLSPSTAGVDRHEKRIAYRCIAALEEYVIVAQDTIEVTVFRREEGWKSELLESRGSILELRSIGLSLPLAEIYAGETLGDVDPGEGVAEPAVNRYAW